LGGLLPKTGETLGYSILFAQVEDSTDKLPTKTDWDAEVNFSLR